jgi:hypothetical protein
MRKSVRERLCVERSANVDGLCDMQVVATLVVAWAEAGLRPTHSFLEAAADTLLADLRSCNADTLTGTLLGYAKLGYCHDGLLDAVAKAVLSSLGKTPLPLAPSLPPPRSSSHIFVSIPNSRCMIQNALPIAGMKGRVLLRTAMFCVMSWVFLNFVRSSDRKA